MDNQEKIKRINETIEDLERDKKMYVDGVEKAKIEVAHLVGEEEPVKKLREERESDLVFYKNRAERAEMIIEALELMKSNLK